MGDELIDGDIAWMLVATTFVLMMTIPGLALYYGGMVRIKNVLSTLMQAFSMACLITILWMLVGYSLVFAPVASFAENSFPFLGNLSRVWLYGLSINSIHQLAPTIPESLFCAFQLTFAIITSALICGSFADRLIN
jgi:Amt family ammonium transporter